MKTDILKIDIDNLSIENFKTFQNHLRDIVVSYNAFVNIMNLEVTKDKNERFHYRLKRSDIQSHILIQINILSSFTSLFITVFLFENFKVLISINIA